MPGIRPRMAPDPSARPLVKSARLSVDYQRLVKQSCPYCVTFPYSVRSAGHRTREELGLGTCGATMLTHTYSIPVTVPLGPEQTAAALIRFFSSMT